MGSPSNVYTNFLNFTSRISKLTLDAIKDSRKSINTKNNPLNIKRRYIILLNSTPYIPIGTYAFFFIYISLI